MRRGTLRKQILAVFLLGGLLPLLILGAAALATTEEAVEQAALNEERGRAIHAAAAISTELAHEAALLEDLADRESTRDAVLSRDATRLQSAAEETVAQGSHLTGMAFVDADGGLIAHGGETAGRGPPPAELVERAARERAPAARLDADQSTLTLVAPVLYGGHVRGYVIAWHDASPLASLLEQERRGAMGALVNGDGEAVLVAGDASLEGRAEPLARFAAEATATETNGAGTVDSLPGGAAIVGFSRLENADGAVVLAQPRATALGPLRPLQWGLGGLLVVIASAASLAAAFTTRRISKPLARLSQTAEAFAAGDLTARSKLEGSAETVSLARTFNAMAERLERQDALLRAHAGSLEQEVAIRTRELVQRNQELEGFSFTAAHELREPLRSMETLTRFVLEDYGETLDPDARRHLEMVHESSGALQRLIFDLLHLDVVTRGSVTVEDVELRAVAEEAKARLAPYAETRRGAIEVLGEFPTVRADRARLTEAVQHLVENGLKFNVSDHPRVVVRGEETPDHVGIRVEDNGIGISPDRYEEIFAPFKKLHRKEEYPGSGVGLTLVKKVAERHGGCVDVAPLAGGGTALTLRVSKAGPIRLRVEREDVEPPRRV